MALQQIVEQTVTGLGYDLVEIERSAGGLLRITIDLPWAGPSGADVGMGNGAPYPGFARPPEGVQSILGQPGERLESLTVEDCEKVTRQLQFALEVEAVEYKRLEVSSPGIDRPLRDQRDFERFAGEVVDITLKAPVGASAQGLVNANRKKFRGTLERVAGQPGAETHWQIVWSEPPLVKPGQKVSKKRPPAPLQALGFSLDEVREARLAPIVNFKGRGAAGAGGESDG